jgi:hypothetical protein
MSCVAKRGRLKLEFNIIWRLSDLIFSNFKGKKFGWDPLNVRLHGKFEFLCKKRKIFLKPTIHIEN